MRKEQIEGAKHGLRYAFMVAGLFEGLEMLHAASLHLQPLAEWEIGMILGAGAGVSSYVADTFGLVTIPSSKERQRTIEQSNGKVVELPWSPPPSRPQID